MMEEYVAKRVLRRSFFYSLRRCGLREMWLCGVDIFLCRSLSRRLFITQRKREAGKSNRYRRCESVLVLSLIRIFLKHFFCRIYCKSLRVKVVNYALRFVKTSKMWYKFRDFKSNRVCLNDKPCVSSLDKTFARCPKEDRCVFVWVKNQLATIILFSQLFLLLLPD